MVGAINLPVTFLNGEIKIYNTTSVSGNRTEVTEIDCYTTAYMKFWEKVMLCNECLIPLILMIVFNSLLIYKTYKSSVKLKKMQEKKIRNLECEKSEIHQREQRDSSINKIPSTTSNVMQNYEKTESFNLIKKNKLSVSDLDLKTFNSNEIKTSKRHSSTPNLSAINKNIHKKLKDCKIKVIIVPPMLPNENSSSKLQKITDLMENKESSNEYDEKMEKKKRKEIESKDSKKKRERIIDNTKHSQRRNRRIVLMLVLLTSSFAISTIPSTIFYSFFRPFMNNKPYKRLLSLIFTLLRHVSHSFNFLIYFKYSSIIKQELNAIINFNRINYFIRVNFMNFIRIWCSKCWCCFLYRLVGKNVPDKYKIRESDFKKKNCNITCKNKNVFKAMLNDSLLPQNDFSKTVANDTKIPMETTFCKNDEDDDKKETKKKRVEYKVEMQYNPKFDNISCSEEERKPTLTDGTTYDGDDDNDDDHQGKIQSNKSINNIQNWKLLIFAINTTNSFKKSLIKQLK